MDPWCFLGVYDFFCTRMWEVSPKEIVEAPPVKRKGLFKSHVTSVEICKRSRPPRKNTNNSMAGATEATHKAKPRRGKHGWNVTVQRLDDTI